MISLRSMYGALDSDAEPRQAPAAVEPEIDLQRLIWDPEYRAEVQARLRRDSESPQPG